jgi:protein-tyrosine-phosphatase
LPKYTRTRTILGDVNPLEDTVIMRRLNLTLALTLVLSGCGLEGPAPRQPEQAKKPEASPAATVAASASAPATASATKPSKRGVATPSAATARYATPQEVLDANQKATNARDWTVVLATVTPESQDVLVGSAAFGAVNLAASDPQIAEVLKKYGIPAEKFRLKPADVRAGNFRDVVNRMNERQRQLLDLIDDKPRFFAEIMEQQEQYLKRMGVSAVPQRPEAKLMDVKINGDAASGKQSVALKGKTVEVPVLFKKVGGSWLLHASMPGEAR